MTALVHKQIAASVLCAGHIWQPCPLCAGGFFPQVLIKVAAQLSPGLTAQWRLGWSRVNITKTHFYKYNLCSKEKVLSSLTQVSLGGGIITLILGDIWI